MHNIFILILMSISIIIIGASTMIYYNKTKKLDGFVFFSIGYLLYYFIIPALVILLLKEKVNPINRFSYSILNGDLEDHIFAVLISLIGYIFFLIFFTISSKIKISVKKYDPMEIKLNYDQSKFVRRFNLIKILAWGIFIVSFFAEVYIVIKLGGISKALTMIEPLRSGSIDKAIYLKSSMLFLFNIYPWIHGATFLFFLMHRIKKSNLNFCMFIISMSCSIYAFLLAGGRLQIILFIVCFLYDYIRKRYKHHILMMILISVVILALLSGLDDLFFYLSHGYMPTWSSNSVASVLEEFAFPYANILNVKEMNKIYNLRYGLDFIGWVTYLVPTKILSLFGIERVGHGYDFITLFHNGLNSHRGGVPTDGLTLGYRQFGILGVSFMMLLYSTVCTTINRITNKIKEDKFAFIYIRISMLLFITIPYADLENVIRGHFSTIVLVIAVNFMFSKFDNKTLET